MSWDAESFCRDHNIVYTHKETSKGWIAVRCPMCSDRRYHGGFNMVVGYYSCWRCGGHNIIATIQALAGVDWFRGRELFKRYLNGYQARTDVEPLRKAISVQMPGDPLTARHRRYLEGRGFDPDALIQKYSIRGTGVKELHKGSDYSNRIMIPVFDHNNSLISFQGRDITGKARERYKGCSKENSVLHYKNTLYGIQEPQNSSCVLVEGIFDKWRMGEGFLATFGTSLKAEQLSILLGYEKVYFLFDPEPEAQEKVKKYGAFLSGFGVEVENLLLETGCDPGDLTEKQASELKSEIFL